MTKEGILKESIVLDPGIGFGKKYEANEYILHALSELHTFGRPLCIGASRKSFIGEITHKKLPGDRLYGSLAAHVIAYMNGAQIIRTHDVAATRDALTVADAILKHNFQKEIDYVA
jgi:dihydropteroate synthase